MIAVIPKTVKAGTKKSPDLPGPDFYVVFLISGAYLTDRLTASSISDWICPGIRMFFMNAQLPAS